MTYILPRYLAHSAAVSPVKSRRRPPSSSSPPALRPHAALRRHTPTRLTDPALRPLIQQVADDPEADPLDVCAALEAIGRLRDPVLVPESTLYTLIQRATLALPRHDPNPNATSPNPDTYPLLNALVRAIEGLSFHPEPGKDALELFHAVWLRARSSILTTTLTSTGASSTTTGRGWGRTNHAAASAHSPSSSSSYSSFSSLLLLTAYRRFFFEPAIEEKYVDFADLQDLPRHLLPRAAHELDLMSAEEIARALQSGLRMGYGVRPASLWPAALLRGADARLGTLAERSLSFGPHPHPHAAKPIPITASSPSAAAPPVSSPVPFIEPEALLRAARWLVTHLQAHAGVPSSHRSESTTSTTPTRRSTTVTSTTPLSVRTAQALVAVIQEGHEALRPVTIIDVLPCLRTAGTPLDEATLLATAPRLRKYLTQHPDARRLQGLLATWDSWAFAPQSTNSFNSSTYRMSGDRSSTSTSSMWVLTPDLDEVGRTIVPTLRTVAAWHGILGHFTRLWAYKKRRADRGGESVTGATAPGTDDPPSLPSSAQQLLGELDLQLVALLSSPSSSEIDVRLSGSICQAWRSVEHQPDQKTLRALWDATWTKTSTTTSSSSSTSMSPRLQLGDRAVARFVTHITRLGLTLSEHEAESVGLVAACGRLEAHTNPGLAEALGRLGCPSAATAHLVSTREVATEGIGGGQGKSREMEDDDNLCSGEREREREDRPDQDLREIDGQRWRRVDVSWVLALHESRARLREQEG